MIAGAPLIKENLDPNETKPLGEKNLIDHAYKNLLALTPNEQDY